MKNFATLAMIAVLAAGSGASASAREHAFLNPQPLPPICALTARSGNPVLDFVRAMFRPDACRHF